MRILSAQFVARYAGRILNIHPSLLPKYPGLHTHRRALEAHEAQHGATVHFVTEQLDGGPPDHPGAGDGGAGRRCGAARRARAVLEHRIYPLAVRWYCTGRLRYARGACVARRHSRSPSPVHYERLSATRGSLNATMGHVGHGIAGRGLSAALACGADAGSRTTPAADAAPMPASQPFSAHYVAEWKDISVGTSDLEARARTRSPGSIIYKWTISARGIFRLVYSHDVTQQSWFSVVDEHMRPERYRGEEGSSSVSFDFDWDAGRARGSIGRQADRSRAQTRISGSDVHPGRDHARS